MKYTDESGEHVEFRIIEEVKAKWQKLAGHLDLPDTTIANETAKPCWTPEGACHNVFTKWLKEEGRPPYTWATLIKVLKEMTEHNVLVRKINLALDNQQKQQMNW